MKTYVDRRTVDLSAYPDLVVIYLGMHINSLRGLKRLFSLGPHIRRAVAEKPDGLLLHENIFFSWRHIGMRQYWRDFEALETWSRSIPHKAWWQEFLHDTGGTGFWHETYFMRGGMEAIYDDMPLSLGFKAFAPIRRAHGPMFTARRRLRLAGEAKLAPPVSQEELTDAHQP